MKNGHSRYKHYKRKTASQKRGQYKISFRVELEELEDYFSNPKNIDSLHQATEKATQAQLNQGVPVVGMEEGIIYRFHPDGRKEHLASSNKSQHKLSHRQYYIQK